MAAKKASQKKVSLKDRLVKKSRKSSEVEKVQTAKASKSVVSRGKLTINANNPGCSGK